MTHHVCRVHFQGAGGEYYAQAPSAVCVGRARSLASAAHWQVLHSSSHMALATAAVLRWSAVQYGGLKEAQQYQTAADEPFFLVSMCLKGQLRSSLRLVTIIESFNARHLTYHTSTSLLTFGTGSFLQFVLTVAHAC
jgi:hypothetical protein